MAVVLLMVVVMVEYESLVVIQCLVWYVNDSANKVLMVLDLPLLVCTNVKF